MPRPKGGYHLKDGTPCPGNTTVLEQLGWSKRGLMWWANQKGLEGKTLKEAQEEEATIGTIIHGLVEAELKGRPQSAPEIPSDWKDRVDNALLGFYEWRDSSRLTITHTELTLISEIHRFGTTLDFPALVNGRRRIVELKTADDLYPDMLIQMAAQGVAWNEHYPHDLLDGYDLLRIGKTDGSFHHDFFPKGSLKMEKAWEVFTHLLQLYRLQKEMK